MPPLGVPSVLKRARKPASRPAKRRKTAAPQPVEVEPHSFESQLRETQLEDAIEAPINGGSEAAVATTIHDDDTSDGCFDEDQMDDFDGIDWLHLQVRQRGKAGSTATVIASPPWPAKASSYTLSAATVTVADISTPAAVVYMRRRAQPRLLLAILSRIAPATATSRLAKQRARP
jgi:hypothetical protein